MASALLDSNEAPSVSAACAISKLLFVLIAVSLPLPDETKRYRVSCAGVVICVSAEKILSSQNARRGPNSLGLPKSTSF
jgi:hypothetical protein